MNISDKKVDRPFLITTIILMALGFFIFISASMGLLTREGAKLSRVIFNQFFFGIIGGSILLIITSKIDYRKYKKYSFYIFFATILLSLLVFVPDLGLKFGGAYRWVSLGFITFQPAEFLKLGFVIILAALLSNANDKKFKFGVLPLISTLLITGVILLQQPDYGTFFIISLAAFSMFFVSGVNWRIFLSLGFLFISSLFTLVYFKEYAWQRILTFLNPSIDGFGAGYQIQQSLIAIGSGGFWGRGFGQSIQKFHSLPEPIGDSIFAVTAEEWGFIGASFLILIFLFLAFRGFFISSRSVDMFGGLLVVGIIILIISQSFINIASMLAIFPLTGVPLLFVSHGGTAMLLVLAEIGIILNVSKNIKI